MPSNTDDGIVIVADEIRKGAVVVVCEGDSFRRLGILDELSARELARAAISTYESHLRDKGMVVVPLKQSQAAYDALSNHGKMWRELNSTEAYGMMVKAAAEALSASPSHSATKSE